MDYSCQPEAGIPYASMERKYEINQKAGENFIIWNPAVLP